MLEKDIVHLTSNVDTNGNLKQDKKKNTLSNIAQRFDELIESQLETGETDLIEIAGNAAISTLITQMTAGLMSTKEETAFLKMLAEKKTKSPVQKIESTSKVDFRISIADAIKENPLALTRSLDRAKQHDQEVLDRLGGNLMLDGETSEEVAATNPGEPPEIIDLRNGGDGSKKIMSWSTRINERN